MDFAATIGADEKTTKTMETLFALMLAARSASVRGESFQRCLFGADLCRVVTDGKTNMNASDIGQTVLESRDGR